MTGRPLKGPGLNEVTPTWGPQEFAYVIQCQYSSSYHLYTKANSPMIFHTDVKFNP